MVENGTEEDAAIDGAFARSVQENPCQTRPNRLVE